MLSVLHNLPDEVSTEYLAQRLASLLKAPLVFTFSGELGAGKTTFIRAMLRELGIKSAIKSPTFALVESYQCDHLQIHHFDLYRIQDEFELDYIGFRDYFQDNSICCIEWPERASHSLEHVDVNFVFAYSGGGRLLTLNATSIAGEKILCNLAGQK